MKPLFNTILITKNIKGSRNISYKPKKQQLQFPFSMLSSSVIALFANEPWGSFMQTIMNTIIWIKLQDIQTRHCLMTAHISAHNLPYSMSNVCINRPQQTIYILLSAKKKHKKNNILSGYHPASMTCRSCIIWTLRLTWFHCLLVRCKLGYLHLMVDKLPLLPVHFSLPHPPHQDHPANKPNSHKTNNIRKLSNTGWQTYGILHIQNNIQWYS